MPSRTALCVFILVVFADCEKLFELPIIHLNDFHARFEETSVTSTRCIDNCVGGFSRIYATVQRIRREKPDSIFLNAGDNFQGTLWYNLHKWNVTQYFFNKLRTDAYTLGNHEFDRGIDGVVPFIQSLSDPVVVANIDDSEEPRMRGLYKKSVVITRQNRTIGVIGVILSSTNEISFTGRLKFTDEVAAVNAEAERLVRQSNCSIIIVLSHCGIEVDKHIASHAGPHISVVVGGHSHTLLYNGPAPSGDAPQGPYPIEVRSEKTGKRVLVVQAFYNAKYLGNLSVWYDSTGNVVSWEGKPIYLNKSWPQDEMINAEINDWKRSIDGVGNELLGFNKVLLDRSNRRRGECNIGSFLTDAMVDHYVKQAGKDEWTYASVAIINSGSIRTSIVPGNITVSDLIIAQPFNNTIDSGELTGQQILDMLEHSVITTKTHKHKFQKFLQFSGLRVVFNVKNSPGYRVESAKILCNKCLVPVYQNINKTASYRIIFPSFMVKGGDGYKIICDNLKNYVQGDIDFDVYSNYIRKMSPITQGHDDRIIVIGMDDMNNRSSLIVPNIITLLTLLYVALN